MGVIQAGTDIQTLQKKGFTPELAQQQYTSMGLNVTRHYNRENNYLKFLWPGIIGAILQQIFLMVIALIFTQEFEKGSFRQLLNYSKSSSYLIFTKSTGYFLYMFVIWNILLYVVFPAFKIDIIGDYFSVMVVSVAFMVTLLAMGIFVSVLVRTQIMATDVLMIMSAPSFIISGFTWPVSQMNHFMQVVAEILPLTHFLSAYRKVLFMGVSWMDVIPELTKLGIMIVGYGLLSWAILKWKIYRTLKREPEYSE
jgi:ABC-2 type transport system permease protein